MGNKKTADAALSLSRASGAVPKEDHPTQSLGRNQHSAAASFENGREILAVFAAKLLSTGRYQTILQAQSPRDAPDEMF